MKQLGLSVALLAISLLGALSGAPIANAISPYDGAIKLTDTITITSADGLMTDDITDEVQYLGSNIIGENRTCTQDNIDSLEIAKQSGTISVGEYTGQSAWGKVMIIAWHEQPKPYLYIFGSYPYIHHEIQGYGIIALQNDGRITFGCYPLNYYQYLEVGTTQDNMNFKLFASTATHDNTPSDYEGAMAPNSFEGNTSEPINEKPKIKMDTMIEWQASFSDQNFFSIDNPPFLCGDGFPPRITMEIWNKSDTTIDGGLILTDTISANSKLDYKFPVVTRHSIDYEIVSWYSCTDGTPFVEPGASFYEFSITEKGALSFKPEIDDCILQDYPWITWDGCIAQLSRGVDALSFGTITVGAASNWTFTDGCHQLGTVGDWMLLENKTVCPVIPTNIRNIITPFVTFALGMMTVKFITKRDGHNL